VSARVHGITGITITPTLERIVCRCGEVLFGPRGTVLDRYQRHRGGETSWYEWCRDAHRRPLPLRALDELQVMELERMVNINPKEKRRKS
jgi:hypothetical protein